MEQYISKSALVAEIERYISNYKVILNKVDKSSDDWLDSTLMLESKIDTLQHILSFLNTLEVKEDVVSTDTTSPNSLKISRHGNSHIEAMTEALRMEYEKGRADVLRLIDPDEMVADFCSQPLSKTRSLASIYRQGITDILRKINNNEENSITGTCSINDCGM